MEEGLSAVSQEAEVAGRLPVLTSSVSPVAAEAQRHVELAPIGGDDQVP